MKQATPGGSVLSMWGGGQGKSGDLWLEGDDRDKGALEVPSQLLEMPSWFTLVAVCPCSWKVRPPLARVRR